MYSIVRPNDPSAVQVGVVGHIAKDVHFAAVRAVALPQLHELASVKHLDTPPSYGLSILPFGEKWKSRTVRYYQKVISFFVQLADEKKSENVFPSKIRIDRM